jgi:nitrate reductase gamma subunit
MGSLSLGVVAAAVWVVAVLGAIRVRARSYGRRTIYSRATQSARPGIVYAFTAGMAPGAKESAREHLGIWFAGVLYHLGIFAGILHLVLVMARITPWLPLLRLLQLGLGAGALGGAILLVRRVASPSLRGLSLPDDYLSNVLVTTFCALGLARSFVPAIEPVFLAETILLLLWMPLGKIRHCLFFFVSRYHQASHFGRRGVFPPVHGASGHGAPVRVMASGAASNQGRRDG